MSIAEAMAIGLTVIGHKFGGGVGLTWVTETQVCL